MSDSAIWPSRAAPGHDRPLEDDLEATIYLARGTLEAAGFTYQGPEGPAPGPFGHAS